MAQPMPTVWSPSEPIPAQILMVSFRSLYGLRDSVVTRVMVELFPLSRVLQILAILFISLLQITVYTPKGPLKADMVW